MFSNAYFRGRRALTKLGTTAPSIQEEWLPQEGIAGRTRLLGFLVYVSVMSSVMVECCLRSSSQISVISSRRPRQCHGGFETFQRYEALVDRLLNEFLEVSLSAVSGWVDFYGSSCGADRPWSGRASDAE